MTTIGSKIREIRKRKGLSQEELAEEAKINLRTIQRIESGKSEPRGKTLNLICVALDIQVEDIVDYGREEDRAYLAMVQLSVLIFLIIPLGNIILPLILWTNKKNQVIGLQSMGANLLNFQIFWSILTYLSIALFTIFKVLHWEGQSVLLFIFFGLYALNLILALSFSFQVRKGNRIDFYPTILRFIR